MSECRSDEANPDGMGSCYPLNQAGEKSGSPRSGDEVPVIVHDTVREHRYGVPIETLSKNLQKVPIILRAQVQRRAAGAAVDDMKVTFRIESTVAYQHAWAPAGSKASAGLAAKALDR
jgi:hypothetical protein